MVTMVQLPEVAMQITNDGILLFYTGFCVLKCVVELTHVVIPYDCPIRKCDFVCQYLENDATYEC